MNRIKYRKSKQKRPTLKAMVEHRPPNPGCTSGGIGWEYVYAAPEPCAHEAPDPCDEATHYDASQTGNVWDGEGP